MQTVTIRPREELFQLFRSDILAFFERITKSHGTFVRVKFGNDSFILANRPDLVRDVLVTQAKFYGKHGQLNKLANLFGNGLLTSDGDYHKQQRLRLQPHFNPAALQSYIRAIFEGVRSRSETWQNSAVIDIDSEFSLLTLEVLGTSIFGDDFSEFAPMVSKLVCELLDLTHTLEGGVHGVTPSARQEEIRCYFDDLFVKLVQKRRREATQKGGDFLATLLSYHVSNEEGGLSDEQIKDEVITMIFAGHETTSSLLAWTLALLVANPSVYDELQGMLRGLPEHDTQSLLAHPFLEAVINESLRLYPPVWNITRKSLTDVTIDGEPIAAGTLVFLSPYMVHRDETIFQDASAFKPERWATRKNDGFNFFPFGAGFRRCIGASFAMMEAKIILGYLLRNGRFTSAKQLSLKARGLTTLKFAEPVNLLWSNQR